MKIFYIFSLLIALSASLIASDKTLNEAIQLYESSLQKTGAEKDKLLKQSIQKMDSIQRSSKLHHPYLDYNIGTAYLQLKDYGKSILHLKRAYHWLKNDSKVVNNLRRAGRLAKVEVFPSSSQDISAIINSYWTSIPTYTWLWITTILAWALALWTWLSKSQKSTFVFSLCLLLLSSSLTFLRAIDYKVPKEIVLLSEYNPKSGLGEQYPNAFSKALPPGSSAKVIRADRGWIEAKWNDNSNAWIPESEISYILPK